MTLLLLGCVRCDFEKRRASSRAQAGGRRRAGRPPRRPFPQQRPQHHPPPASLRSGAKRQRGRGRRPSGQSPAPRRTALPMPHANGGLSSKHLSFPTARCLALGQCHTAIGGVRGRARHHKLREDEDEADGPTPMPEAQSTAPCHSTVQDDEPATRSTRPRPSRHSSGHLAPCSRERAAAGV